MIAAYHEPDRAKGRQLMTRLIASTSQGVPAALTGRTLTRRAADILAHFDRPLTGNGPTEAINGRLEHLRGTTLGFPQPGQLHRQITTRDRRIQTTTTPSIVVSPFSEHMATDQTLEWPTVLGGTFSTAAEGLGDSRDAVCVASVSGDRGRPAMPAPVVPAREARWWAIDRFTAVEFARRWDADDRSPRR